MPDDSENSHRHRSTPGTDGATHGRTGKHFAHGREGKFVEQPSEARLAAGKVRVMPQPRLETGAHARLTRIDLPRVQIEDERSLLAFVDAGERGARDPVRK